MSTPTQRREPEVHLASLSRLRWAAMAGELLVLVVVGLALGVALPVGTLAIVLLVQLALCVASWVVERKRLASAGLLTALLAVDVGIFTALLALTGGAANPFSFLYLVYIALAAFMLRAAQTWLLVGLSTLGFALLFAVDGGGSGHEHHAMGQGEMTGMGGMQLHLIGMWGAFVVAAVFIVFFVQSLLAQLRARDQVLAGLKQQQERGSRLAALGTLAAGAAHELATPLSTIAVASSELAEGLRSAAGETCAELADVADVIRAEVERCRSILEQLAVDAGTPASASLAAVPAPSVLEGAVPEGEEARVVIDVDTAAAKTVVRAPARLCARALRGVISNALRAGPDDVKMELRMVDGAVQIAVVDRGGGMPPDVLARASEPFFTTRPTGDGMGLGLFVARSVFEGLGGAMSVTSTLGEGTRVTLTLPVAADVPGKEAA
jgi:two-component system sensor histidine kinase RegB